MPVLFHRPRFVARLACGSAGRTATCLKRIGKNCEVVFANAF